MTNLLQDVRYSLRGIRANPGFSAIGVLTLGLGIGANAAMFSVVNAFLLRPLPVPDADELVVVASMTEIVEFPIGVSYPNFEDYRDGAAVLSDLAVYFPMLVSVNVDGNARRSVVEAVSGNYFDMLRVPMALGRSFSGDEATVPGAAPVLVLDHEYWQSQFAGDPDVLGRTIKVNEQPFTVIGVAAPDFPGTEFLGRPNAYASMMMLEQLQPSFAGALERRRAAFLRAMGRLAPGITVEQADAGLNAIAAELRRTYPDDNDGISLVVVPETQARPEASAAGLVSPVAGLLMALVGMVLLIACANVAGLLLVRASARRNELAVRAALGAGRARLLRQLITDSLVLGLLGGLAGVALGYWGSGWVASVFNNWPGDLPVNVNLAPDATVLGFTVVISVLTGLIAGAFPALQLSRGDLADALKNGGRTGAESGRHRLRSMLVVAQVAVSMLLLVAAGLFARSLQSARQIDLGFSTEDQLMASIDPRLVDYDDEEAALFFERVLERAAALPGVESVTLTTVVPFSGNISFAEVVADGRDLAPDESLPAAILHRVGPDYFETVGTEIVRGRGLLPEDTAEARKVAVVNEALAEAAWPGEDPIGRRFTTQRGAEPDTEVVGVARDTKMVLIWEEGRPGLYMPLAQSFASPVTVQLRTRGEPAGIAPSLRQAILTEDPNMLVYGVQTMETHLATGNALMIVRVAAVIVGTFGLIAAVLVAVGLYGVISYSVARRSHEIGIRMALGARAGDVLRSVVGSGFGLVLAGMALGLLGALVLSQLMANLLVGVSPTDMVTFVAVPTLLLAVALLASFVPARRAVGVDPLVALRD